MELPNTWKTMTEGTRPTSSHNVSVTLGGKSATFVFHVSQQPSSTRSIATLALDYDLYSLSFLVTDATDYTAQSNPQTVFENGFTTAIITALRSLIANGSSGIPKPGDPISYGGLASAVVDTVDISQLQDSVVDAFEVVCNVKKPLPGSIETLGRSSPKVAKSDEVPPWQEPAQVRFESQTTEGMTFGYAYKTKDLEDTQSQDMDGLRKAGVVSKNQMDVVANTAGDPFASPPMFPKVSGTLHLSRAFLRSETSVVIEPDVTTVNRGDISITMSGATLIFPAGSLAIGGYGITPRLYKEAVPWYSKTKHPLNKTYGELFYGYSGQLSNQVAVNGTNNTIVVYRPITYLQVNAVLNFKPEGFGVWIANKGYAEMKGGKLETIIDTRTQTVKEGWLDAKGAHTTEKKIWRGYTLYRAANDVSNMLKMFFKDIGGGEFSWATTNDNFGRPI